LTPAQKAKAQAELSAIMASPSSVDGLIVSSILEGMSHAGTAARDFAINWNRTLRDAVDETGTIDLNRSITAHELGDRQMTVREWAQNLLTTHGGYDELFRWANNVGGVTGQKTLALLGALGNGQFGFEPTPGGQADIFTSPGQPTHVQGPALLDAR